MKIIHGALAILICATTGLMSAGSAAAGGETHSAKLTLPDGDPVAGRQAFRDLRCYACHSVAGDADMPKPYSANRGPEIGPRQASQTPEMLADSIISPSHVLPPGEKGGSSPMGNYRSTMTVEQLIDVVAYMRGQ
ncbi:MAG: c-type cytochrome [Nitrospirota bacterium]|jgi:mono/diheme cytochrome c family protein